MPSGLDNPSSPPKVFGIWFEDLSRWDPSSFHSITWNWPRNALVPLGSVLTVRKIKVDRKKYNFVDLQPITIHFDGSIEKRQLSGNREYSMDLYFAFPGDIIVAKIDLKNGAVAIVPDNWKNVVVTGHFAVYEIDISRIDPQYLHRLIQTSIFKEQLWRNKVGTEGRKEVKLDFFESELIPLPELSVQRSIVQASEKVNSDILNIQTQILELETQIESDFCENLGLQKKESITSPNVFGVRWEDLDRWSVMFNQQKSTSIDVTNGKYRVITLGEVSTVSYGIQKCPSNRPGQYSRPYLRVANVQRGFLNLTEIKKINVPDSDMSSYRLEKGDLLFVEGNGSRRELGRCAIWNGEIPDCVHQNHILKVRPFPDKLSSEYAMTWFNTELGKDHFFRSVKTSSGLGTINSTELRAAPIPIPPLSVQLDLVEHVKEIRKKIADLKVDLADKAYQGKIDVDSMILGDKRMSEN